MRPAVEVSGAKELRRNLTRLDKSLLSGLRPAYKKGADIVASAVRNEVRSRSGKLQRSVRGTATRASGSVAAGNSRVVYAGVQNYGNPTKKGRLGVIRPQQFMQTGLERSEPDVVKAVSEALGDVIKNAGL